MKKRVNRKTRLFVIFLLLCTSQSNKLMPEANPEQDSGKIFKNQYHENMWGVYIQKKDPLKAFNIFANLTKSNKYAYKWLISFLYKTGNNQKLASITPLIKSAFPQLLTDDPDAGFMVAYALTCNNVNPVLENCNNTPITYNKAAAEIIVPLNRKFPANQQVAALASTLYDLINDPRNAIETSEKYLNLNSPKPTDFIEYFKNASRYMKLEKPDIAIKNAKKSIELQPKFPNSWILLATIYDQMDKTTEAIDCCKKALDASGPNKIIEYMIVRLFFKQKKAQHLVTEFVMDKKCFENAIELIGKRKYDTAFTLMDKCLAEKMKQQPPTQDAKQEKQGVSGTKAGKNTEKNIQDKNIVKIKLIKNDKNIGNASKKSKTIIANYKPDIKHKKNLRK